MKLSSAIASSGFVASVGASGPPPGGPGFGGPEFGDPGFGGPGFGGPGFGGPGNGFDNLLTDINQISRYWGQVSTYVENPENYFGVQAVGLPDGCQIEQVHALHRHGDRFPTSSNNVKFAKKVTNFTATNPDLKFTGPLSFLNTYQYVLGSNGLLTGLGAATEFKAGVTFWNRYGRTLYNATTGQLAYNATAPDGTPRRKPLLRTTNQSRMWNSQIAWAAGFFGTTFEALPNPDFANVTDAFEVVIIPEGGKENNTLAAYDSCFNSNVDSIGYIGDEDLYTYIPKYIGAATDRLQQFAPEGFTFSTNDTYAFQTICSYETGYIGMSDFCYLFTEDEWASFEHTLDILYYYDYSFGNPVGRSEGIGYILELLARLQSQYINSSSSAINSTLDNNPSTFPLDLPFYVDFSHDDIIISALTALSLDYFKDPPNLNQVPPDPFRHFILSHITPFGGRLMTEVIGCVDPNPPPNFWPRVQYQPGQYGYDKDKAVNKFIRMNVNHGILPLDTIRGGFCQGRIDGLCPLDRFLESQVGAEEKANYQFACFGNYSIDNDADPGKDYDGTITP